MARHRLPWGKKKGRTICASLHVKEKSLEGEDEAPADAPALGGGVVEVVEAAHVFDVKHLEDVVQTYVCLNIGALAIHRPSDGCKVTRSVEGAGEVVEVGTVGVLRQQGIVLRCEVSPEGAEAEVFAQLQVLDERNAVEDFAVQFPRAEERGIAVVEKLHVAQEAEGVVVLDVREVGSGHDEVGEGHAVPLRSSLELHVYAPPRGSPEALVDASFGEVVGVVATQYALDAEGVLQGQFGRIVVCRYAALLRVHPLHARLIGERKGGFRSAEVVDVVLLVGRDCSRAEGLVEEARRGAVFLHLCREAVGEAVFVFSSVACAPVFRIEHVLNGRPFEGGKDVVLVRSHELVGG